jgi:hypothetical protein
MKKTMKKTTKKNRNKAKTSKSMKGGGIFDYFYPKKPEDVDMDQSAIGIANIKNKPESSDGNTESYKDKALNAATSAFDMLKSGFSGLTSGITSLSHLFVHDPNAVPKPKPLGKTEVFIGTETTDYKHPLDGTNIGQTSVYKKTNSTNVDSVKSVDNFLSRMQQEILNSSEKDPVQIKSPEELFKNKDTEKRLGVFHALNDKSKGGKKSKCKTRKYISSKKNK